MKRFIFIYLIGSIIFALYTIRQYIIEHIQLKYGADDFNLVGEDPYEIIKYQSNDMINYIYVVGIYILFNIIMGIYILKKMKNHL
jgi:hypothetical protein